MWRATNEKVGLSGLELAYRGRDMSLAESKIAYCEREMGLTESKVDYYGREKVLTKSKNALNLKEWTLKNNKVWVIIIVKSKYFHGKKSVIIS